MTRVDTEETAVAVTTDAPALASTADPGALKNLAEKAADGEESDGDTVFATTTLASEEKSFDACTDDDDSFEDQATESCGEEMLTPVQAIANAALDTALPVDVRAHLEAGDPIAVVIAVPGPDWVEGIRGAVRTISRRAKTIERDGSLRKDHVPTKGNLDIGAWLADGFPVVGISQAPATFLPSTLLAVADATLEVRAPDGATLSRILALTNRTAPADIPASICGGMTFAEIFAAFRKGLDGDGVVDALARITARKAGAEVDDGVPPLPELPGHSGEARAWGTTLISDFLEWRAGRRAWRDVSASAVLGGPPGTGKTMFARSLAKALGVQLLSEGVGNWFARTEGNLGDIAVAFQSLWDRAMAARPCVLFLDELDAIPDRASLSNRGRDWWLPIITLILTTTDGAQTSRDGLVLIGATNHGNRLDSALIRRGRFDRLIQVDLPTAHDLAEIIAHHLNGALGIKELEPIMRLSHGASAADAAAWAREVRSAALSAGRPVSLADVAAAVAPPDYRPAELVRRCAIHEAGHVVVGRRLGSRVESVSIVPVGASGGRTVADHDIGMATRADLERVVTVSLGGRAAEEALLGAPSAGAVGDLAKATGLLASVHATVGLGGSLVHRASDEAATALLVHDAALRQTVEDHLSRLYADARRIVETERDVVLGIADALVARRHLSGDDIEALAGRHVAGATR